MVTLEEAAELKDLLFWCYSVVSERVGIIVFEK